MGTETSKFAFYKPAVGEEDWGEEVNASFDELDSRLIDLGVNVKATAYGAVGDGVTDDGTAIQAAITAAGTGGTVYFPKGTYKFATGLTFLDGTKLIGAARGGVTLSYTGSGKALSQTTPSTRIYDCQFRNFVLAGTGSGTHGIDLDSVTDCLIDDVTVTGFTAGIGIRIYSPTAGYSVYNHLENVIITSCSTGLNISGSASNASTFHAGRIASCTTYGVNIVDSNATVVSETAFESNATAVRLYDSLGGATVHNIFSADRFEANTTDFIFDGCRYTTVAHPSTIDGALVTSALATTVTGWSNNIIHDAVGYQLNLESIASAHSPFVLKRAVNVAGGYPAVLIQDTATGSTNPVAVQIEQEDDGTFLRCRKGSTTYFDVSTAGKVTAAGEVEIDGALNHDGTTVGFFGVTPAARPTTYSATNVVTDRSYDANATTTEELADVLGTLIADLRTMGLVT